MTADSDRVPSQTSDAPLARRAAELIATLGLSPHPEGGFYVQLYRSSSLVAPADTRPPRASLTTIYFLLPGHDVSRWHSVLSDEAWHFYEGAPLELFTADAEFTRVDTHMLGEVGASTTPVHVVPAGHWQAARSTGAYTLVGCTVGPGFEFADFAMLRDDAARTEHVRRRHPSVAALV